MPFSHSGITRRGLFTGQALPNDKDLLVCIFQRGAADGLNSVVPYGDSDYALQRGNLAVPPPNQTNGAIDLDGYFGFHPALAPLKPIYDAGDLAMVHATGFPHGSRSHFSAQGLVERGVMDKSDPNNDGWLGRHLSLSSGTPGSAFRTVAISGNVPVALTGADQPLAISQLNDFGFDQEIIDSGYTDILNNLYGSAVPFSSPALAALSAIDELTAADLNNITPINGDYPNTVLGGKLAQVAKLVKSSLPVEVICLDSDGWDHHENLPFYVDQSLSELAGALAHFYTDMDTRMQNITVLVYTEFGRRVAKNASNGVDHGTGACTYLMGGGVNGGQVIADWPGLATANLEMNEDLKITTDMRDVLIELLDKRIGGTDTSLVFPGFSLADPLNLFNTDS